MPCIHSYIYSASTFPVGVAGGVSTGVLLSGSGVGRNDHHGQLQQVQQQLSQVRSLGICSRGQRIKAGGLLELKKPRVVRN